MLTCLYTVPNRLLTMVKLSSCYREDLRAYRLKYLLSGLLRKSPTPGLNKKFQANSHLHSIKCFGMFFQEERKNLIKTKSYSPQIKSIALKLRKK